jgi:hypothetical protein
MRGRIRDHCAHGVLQNLFALPTHACTQCIDLFDSVLHVEDVDPCMHVCWVCMCVDERSLKRENKKSLCADACVQCMHVWCVSADACVQCMHVWCVSAV